jgi:hypothetical protein
MNVHITVKTQQEAAGPVKSIRGCTQRCNLIAESSSFLEKTQIFEKSVLRDNNCFEFFLPSTLNDPDEQNQLPIGYLFATR